MTTQVSTKVRLVRCPKCRQVLAELPEVPLYKCGGCGTVLQAKNRKLETSSTGLSSQETDSIANKDFTSRPEAESLSDKDNIRCRDENSDSVELREDASVLSSSHSVACPRNEDSSIEANDFKRYNIKFGDDNGESSRGREFSDELPSSGEFTLEAEVYNTPESSEHVEQHKKDQTGGEESQRVWQKGDNFVAKVHNFPEHEYPEGVLSPQRKKDNHASPENDDKSRICFADQNRDFHGVIKPSGLDSSLGIISRENENISPSAEQSTEKNTNASVCDSNVTSRSPSKESLVSFYLTSPDNEHPDHFLREATRNFGRLSSLDTLGSSAPPMTNYPKTESYYAYDGSESSYDGTDDQICERLSQPSRQNKDVDIRTTEMLRKKNGYRANNTANSEPEWGPTNSSHRATMRNNHWSQSPETNKYAGGNRMRLDEQEGVSRVPFPSMTGPGLTGYRHGSLPPRPVFKSSYPEPDKIDLLRTVCELQDQLNRMHFPEVRRYNHFSPERDIYSDVRHPHIYNLRHNQRHVSRLAFSGEAAQYGPQVSCCCLHSGQDWRYSAPLPPHNSMHRKNGPWGVHACCNISEASLWGYETKFENQRHDEDIIKRTRLKEKYFAAKRHMRPVAGGAPMVVCYHCSELLRLPADFLLLRKKYHQVMCDACKKVLRFSVRKGTHIVPYVPEASIPPPPPPSEADKYNDAAGRGNTKPPSHSSSLRRVGRPVSCSDDYGDGRSFGRSCSTEGEYYNGKMSPGSSYEAIEDRKMKSISTEPEDEIESLTKGDESVGPLSKWRKANLEIEEASSSPLHRLMGYSSPSQVLDK